MREENPKGKQMRKWCAGVASVLMAGSMAFTAVGVANADSTGLSEQQAVTVNKSVDTKADSRAQNDRVDVSNVRVSEIGAHTAKLTFDYHVSNPEGTIKEFIPFITMDRILGVTQNAPIDAWGSADFPLGGGPNGFDESGTPDDQLTQETYQELYGINKYPVKLGDDQVGSYRAQSFQRWITSKELGDQEHQNNGTMSITLIGLEQSTLYATRLDRFNMNNEDWSDSGIDDVILAKLQALNPNNDSSKFNQEVPVDMTRLMVGMKVRYVKTETSGNAAVSTEYNQAFLKQVPDFTTLSEPQSLAEDKLTDQNKGDMLPGQVQADQSSRFYINSLKQDCKVRVDADHDCFWYSYIYSNPVRLNGTDGAPYVRIKKDDRNRYYFDAFIPAAYQGDHKVSLVDENGQVQAWTPVQIKGKDVMVPTVDKSKLNAAIDSASKLVQSDYTENSWAAFAKALKAARDASVQGDVSQSWVDTVLQNLLDMQSRLIKVAPDSGSALGNTTENKGRQQASIQDPKDNNKGKLAMTGSDLIPVAIAALVFSLIGVGVVHMRRICS